MTQKKEQYVEGWIMILGIFLALVLAFSAVFIYIVIEYEINKSGQLETSPRFAAMHGAPLVLLSDLIDPVFFLSRPTVRRVI